MVEWWLSSGWFEDRLVIPNKRAVMLTSSLGITLNIFLFFVVVFRNLKTTFPRCICQDTSLLALPTGVIGRRVKSEFLSPGVKKNDSFWQ